MTSTEHERTGVWLVGARGSVGTTTVVGALALRSGLSDSTGLVSGLPEVALAGLPDLRDLVFGGHDVDTGSLGKRAELLAAGGVIPLALLPLLEHELAEVDARILVGLQPGGDESQADGIARLQRDLERFRAEHHLARVVVIDVSSTEPPVRDPATVADLETVELALAAEESPLPTSSAYALAAFRAGCAFVSFTPSPGPRPPALMQAAARYAVPWAGSDGKTGETLVKTVLAPMFATRALRVRSWASYNMLGGGDGRTLADPEAAASKKDSKARGLESILGHPVDGPMHIDYVPDAGDWKTAMDHVSFEGFLGVRMSMQFTWSGCDSALAAPLILDLARLTARAHEAGRVGPVSELGFFFKDPAGSDEHRLSAQWDALLAMCAELGGAR
ncbi:MAG: inositol-3-phosphate synthase [Nocardioides sp.]|uniref:inositol-3-phosphate synthase n=1 Tax=Nocardioides sp. TaxID=35761 RepID=UPI0032674F51